MVLSDDFSARGEVGSYELRLQAPNVHDLKKQDRLLTWVARCAGSSVWKRIWFYHEIHRKVFWVTSQPIKEKNLQSSLLFADGRQGFNVSSVGQAVVPRQVLRESLISSHILCRTPVLQISWGTRKEQHGWLLSWWAWFSIRAGFEAVGFKKLILEKATL